MEERHQVALKNLISAVTDQPVLTYLDFTNDFLIYADASSMNGLSCALYQQHQDQLIVTGTSRILVGIKKRYHSSKSKNLALKWAVRYHFKPYLYYVKHFDSFTDNNPVF